MKPSELWEIIKTQPDEKWAKGRFVRFEYNQEFTEYRAQYCALGWVLHQQGYLDNEIDTIAVEDAADELGLPDSVMWQLIDANDFAHEHDAAKRRLYKVLHSLEEAPR